MTAPASDQSAIEVAFVDDDPDLRDANAQALRLAGFAAIPLPSVTGYPLKRTFP